MQLNNFRALLRMRVYMAGASELGPESRVKSTKDPTNVVPKIIRDPTSVVILNSGPNSDAAYVAINKYKINEIIQYAAKSFATISKQFGRFDYYSNSSLTLVRVRDSERSDEFIDFTMMCIFLVPVYSITYRNNVSITNFRVGFRWQIEYYWCIIIEVKKTNHCKYMKISPNAYTSTTEVLDFF
ncbi:hypothetical protein AGLY_000292 [Aphis glycines]|uniref:Uncharacterized protein n=1 Tax=Aphis glycines TaxID=307491 RepID=A0A6G0U7J9_APHGL|nr:hypothetical protein AGLY_000292 [Aphis glycines]